MPRVAFEKGWHELGNSHYAYLQPSGTWGYSNAGLVVDGDQALLVDTLFDERLTAEMLAAMPDVTGITTDAIGTLVNSHANGDHTYGNRLVTQANIVTSAASAHEMQFEDAPERLAAIMRQTGTLGDLGIYLDAIFGAFDFDSVRQKLADQTFTGKMDLSVGGKQVHLIEVGPAHTAGDLLVHIPQDRVVYTGDILFVEGTPIMWAGPVRNWLAACDRILAMDVDTIVPGHGPTTDKAGVRGVRSYLAYIEDETIKRHAAGMGSWEIAQDIALAEFGALEDPERIAVTVDTIFREITNDQSQRDVPALFGRMMILDKKSNPGRYAKADPCATHAHG